ncbi:DUF3145 family protein [Salininema proteolyticum]|uniref:DUF3145 family protein n=1 Tax=Salininema proteolyticum TaxID=1607685 RepID=A0ABV8U1X9_9ACTN
MSTRGVIYVHSSPAAVCPHVEWSIGRVLGVTGVKFGWAPQPVEKGAMRASRAWVAEPGAAAEIASALMQWPMLRFEITEQPSEGRDGERIMYLPERGVYRAAMSADGSVMVAEDRIRALMATTTSAEALRSGLHQLLGLEWEQELAPYRESGHQQEQSWLAHVS